MLMSVCLLAFCGCLEDKSKTTDDLEDARIYLRQRDFMEAEKSFERYLRRNPNGADRWEVWNHLADMALTVRHDRNSAIELFEAMMLEYETQPEYRRQVQDKLAAEYEQVRRYEKSVELWGKLVQDPEVPSLQKADSYRNLARIYLRRLEFELAKESLGYCMDLDIPQVAKANCQYDLADVYMTMDDLKAGITELRSLLEQRDVDNDLRVLSVFMLADALEQQGSRDTALGLFESIRYIYPNPRVIESRIDYLRKQLKK